jgi:ribosome-associated heat shock protein Hsp15
VNPPKEIRLDTYLWAIRMFKSRTLASDAIKGGKVKMKDTAVKASHVVKIGEVYTITISSDYKKIIEVTALLEKRQSYEIAKQHYIDHSPLMEKKDMEDKAFFSMNLKNKKGSGRPTKKDRRDLGKEGGWF